MTTTKSNYDKLRSRVHEGVPLEKETISKADNMEQKENLSENESIEKTDNTKSISLPETVAVNDVPSMKTPSPVEPVRRKRKPTDDYQSRFFTRVDFTYRKPLYITAATHRRLMRIVHLMDGSRATISSYVENILLGHLDMFREEIDTIYRDNNLNPTEE